MKTALLLMLIVAGLVGVTTTAVIQVNAALKVQNLNDFFVQNRTTGEPMLAVVGLATNDGNETQMKIDFSLALYDNKGEIVGTSFLYDDDVKVNDTIPFQFTVPSTDIKNGDFGAIMNYSVIAE